MKKLLLIILISGGLFENAHAISTQSTFSSEKITVKKENPFAFFNAHRQGRSTIGLMWRFKPLSNVVSFELQRSYDGEFFTSVIEIQNGNNSRLSWKDNNVLPGYIYYRIVANLADGTYVMSNVEIVRIVQK